MLKMCSNFLPSEIARLVLGYLQDTSCPISYGHFLKESPYLQECRMIVEQSGLDLLPNLWCMNLVEMLNDYAIIKANIKQQVNLKSKLVSKKDLNSSSAFDFPYQEKSMLMSSYHEAPYNAESYTKKIGISEIASQSHRSAICGLAQVERCPRVTTQRHFNDNFYAQSNTNSFLKAQPLSEPVKATPVKRGRRRKTFDRCKERSVTRASAKNMTTSVEIDCKPEIAHKSTTVINSTIPSNTIKNGSKFELFKPNEPSNSTNSPEDGFNVSFSQCIDTATECVLETPGKTHHRKKRTPKRINLPSAIIALPNCVDNIQEALDIDRALGRILSSPGKMAAGINQAAAAGCSLQTDALQELLDVLNAGSAFSTTPADSLLDALLEASCNLPVNEDVLSSREVDEAVASLALVNKLHGESVLSSLTCRDKDENMDKLEIGSCTSREIQGQPISTPSTSCLLSTLTVQLEAGTEALSSALKVSNPTAVEASYSVENNSTSTEPMCFVQNDSMLTDALCSLERGTSVMEVYSVEKDSSTTGELCSDKKNTSTIEELCSGKKNTSSIEELCSDKKNTSTVEELCFDKKNTSTIDELCSDKKNTFTIEELCSGKKNTSTIEELCSDKKNTSTVEGLCFSKKDNSIMEELCSSKRNTSASTSVELSFGKNDASALEKLCFGKKNRSASEGSCPRQKNTPASEELFSVKKETFTEEIFSAKSYCVEKDAAVGKDLIPTKETFFEKNDAYEEYMENISRESLNCTEKDFANKNFLDSTQKDASAVEALCFGEKDASVIESLCSGEKYSPGIKSFYFVERDAPTKKKVSVVEELLSVQKHGNISMKASDAYNGTDFREILQTYVADCPKSSGVTFVNEFYAIPVINITSDNNMIVSNFSIIPKHELEAASVSSTANKPDTNMVPPDIKSVIDTTIVSLSNQKHGFEPASVSSTTNELDDVEEIDVCSVSLSHQPNVKFCTYSESVVDTHASTLTCQRVRLHRLGCARTRGPYFRLELIKSDKQRFADKIESRTGSKKSMVNVVAAEEFDSGPDSTGCVSPSKNAVPSFVLKDKRNLSNLDVKLETQLVEKHLVTPSLIDVDAEFANYMKTSTDFYQPCTSTDSAGNAFSVTSKGITSKMDDASDALCCQSFQISGKRRAQRNLSAALQDLTSCKPRHCSTPHASPPPLKKRILHRVEEEQQQQLQLHQGQNFVLVNAAPLPYETHTLVPPAQMLTRFPSFDSCSLDSVATDLEMLTPGKMQCLASKGLVVPSKDIKNCEFENADCQQEVDNFAVANNSKSLFMDVDCKNNEPLTVKADSSHSFIGRLGDMNVEKFLSQIYTVLPN